MTRVIAKNGRATLIVLAMTLAALSGWARADVPGTAALESEPAAAPTEAPVADAAAPAAAVAEPPDRLLEIVVEYLEAAFVREPRASRTASLQPAAPAAGLQ